MNTKMNTSSDLIDVDPYNDPDKRGETPALIDRNEKYHINVDSISTPKSPQAVPPLNGVRKNSTESTASRSKKPLNSRDVVDLLDKKDLETFK